MTTSWVLSAESVWGGDGIIGDTLHIRDGLIEAVTTGGGDADEHYQGVIVPRFIDSHFHPFDYIASRTGLSLGTADDMSEVLQRLAEADADLPEGVALVADGFDDSVIGRMPTATELDTVTMDRPIVVHRICGHVASANTPALQIAGVVDDRPDPEAGSFRRDGMGRLTGVFDETAVGMVTAAIGPLTPIPDEETGISILGELTSLGIFRIGAMVAMSDTETDQTDPLHTLRRVGDRLPLALDVIVITDDPADLSRASSLLDGTERSRFWGWKGFADGSLGGRTAALAEPYWDAPDARGTTRLDGDHALDMTRTSLGLGGVSAIHAIGDAALANVLDVFARAIDEGADPRRLRVEHVSVASPSLIKRIAELGVVASVQPSFPVSDSVWLEDRLGPERMSRAYPFTALSASGVPLIFSSDAPVETPDVVAALSHAVSSGLTPEQALAGYTTTPRDLLGLGEPFALGSPADFVLLDGPPGKAESVIGVWANGLRLAGAPRNLGQ
ncbi:MAG: amidohydrolase family protein [Acidimicrobiia bacterium]|nr:amidohydrolase family protein [Acidimicrobiia bacterium]